MIRNSAKFKEVEKKEMPIFLSKNRVAQKIIINIFVKSTKVENIHKSIEIHLEHLLGKRTFTYVYIIFLCPLKVIYIVILTLNAILYSENVSRQKVLLRARKRGNRSPQRSNRIIISSHQSFHHIIPPRNEV